MIFLGIPLIYWGLTALVAAAAAEAACGSPVGKPVNGPGPQPRKIPGGPLPDANPTELLPNDGGPGADPIDRFIPPQNSFFAIICGRGIVSPETRPQPAADGGVPDGGSTDGGTGNWTAPAGPQDGCFVMSVSRQSTAQGETTDGGVTPYSTYGQWTMQSTAPIPEEDDPSTPTDEANLHRQSNMMFSSRRMGHPLNNLYRGFVGTPLRTAGSVGTLFSGTSSSDGGTPEQNAARNVGAEAGMVWGVHLGVNDQGLSSLRFNQAKENSEGSGYVDSPATLVAIVLPFYAPGSPDRFQGFLDNFSTRYPNEHAPQSFTICNNDNPCPTGGGSSADEITATLVNLPREGNQADAMAAAVNNTFGIQNDLADESSLLLMTPEITLDNRNLIPNR